MHDSTGALSTLFSQKGFLSGFTEAWLLCAIPVSPCQQSDPEGECCDMRLVQIRNQAEPSELIPKYVYEEPS